VVDVCGWSVCLVVECGGEVCEWWRVEDVGVWNVVCGNRTWRRSVRVYRWCVWWSAWKMIDGGGV